MQPASKVSTPDMLPARLPKGTELDGYVVEGWVRDGGMAAIYRARRASDGVRVALKLQLPSTTHVPEICRRFDCEAEAMRRVTRAPHVVELHHAGVLDDERRYFMMEWVEGENLEERLDSLRNEDKRFPVQDVCELGLDIARGLATMHAHQLVHRDLKPSNVMVGRSDEDALVVKLVDFGIVADLRAESGSAGDEAHEEVMGTSAYMAPEQRAGHPPTPAMDVFALGVMLYEALTGTCVPPDGWTPETLPSIESLRRNVVPELVALVRACMSSDVTRRPRTGSEVVSQLAVILGPLKAKEARLEPSEVPIRTGGTVVVPRAQIAALEESAARTGGTEVSLTHAHVLTISAPVQPPVSVGAAEPATKPGVSVVEPVQPPVSGEVESSAAVSKAVASLQPPVSASVVVPVSKPSMSVVAPVQQASSGVHAVKPKQPQSASVLEPKPSPVSASVLVPVSKPSATVLVPVELPARASVAAPVPKGNTLVVAPVPVVAVAAEYEYEDDEEDALPRRRWPWVAAVLVPVVALGAWVLMQGRDDDITRSEAPIMVIARTPDPPPDDAPIPADELTEPSPARELTPDGPGFDARSKSVAKQKGTRASSGGELASDASTRSRSKAADKAACEKQRTDVNDAKSRRDWRGVLEATRRTKCWPGPLKLDRRQLRVEAHAELDNFASCVKEGGSSSDPKIVASVKWCNKNLGT